jgi:hypothetical protein
MIHQRIPRAMLTARLSQRTHPETKTTVALKNMNAIKEWMTIVIQRFPQTMRLRAPPDPDHVESPHSRECVVAVKAFS